MRVRRHVLDEKQCGIHARPGPGPRELCIGQRRIIGYYRMLEAAETQVSTGVQTLESADPIYNKINCGQASGALLYFGLLRLWQGLASG